MTKTNKYDIILIEVIIFMMYSIIKAAKTLGVTTYTLRNWCKAKKIKSVKIPCDAPHSRWYIPEEEIIRLREGLPNDNEN